MRGPERGAASLLIISFAISLCGAATLIIAVGAPFADPDVTDASRGGSSQPDTAKTTPIRVSKTAVRIRSFLYETKVAV